VGGIITDKITKTTKNNNLMAFVTLEDLYGSMEVIVFPNVLIKYGSLLVKENAVFIDGRLSVREEEQPKIICETVRPIRKKDDAGNGQTEFPEQEVQHISNGQNKIPDKIFIRTDASPDSILLQSTFSLLKYFHGTTPVQFCSVDEKGNISKMKTEEYNVQMCETLHKELLERFGEENVKFVSKHR